MQVLPQLEEGRARIVQLEKNVASAAQQEKGLKAIAGKVDALAAANATLEAERARCDVYIFSCLLCMIP